jgi:hypothetical protein
VKELKLGCSIVGAIVAYSCLLKILDELLKESLYCLAPPTSP